MFIVTEYAALRLIFYSCSTQLSTNFQLLVKSNILKNKECSCFMSGMSDMFNRSEHKKTHGLICNHRCKEFLTSKEPTKSNMLSAELVCCKYLLILLTNVSNEANSVDPDQTATTKTV